MNALNRVMGYAACAGFLFSLLIHILSISGFDLQMYIPFVWVMHVLVFPPFGYAIVTMNKDPKVNEIRKRNPRGGIELLRLLLSKTPVWLTLLLPLLMVYTTFNFVNFIANTGGGVPEKVGEVYSLMHRGEFLRSINVEEYHRFRANQLRGFSGHWMLFYAVAAALQWPFQKSAVKK